MITPSQLYYDKNPGRDWLWFGLGAQYTFFNRLMLFIDYDLLHNSRISSHIGSAGISLEW